MILALFDLDHTLLDGDSDCLWTEFLTEEGILGPEHLRRSSDFFAGYLRGEMDNEAFLRFQLEPLTWFSLPRLEQLRNRFVESKIQPRIPEASRRLVEWHRRQSHWLAIVTATNCFVTEPIAHMLDIPVLLATELEVQDGFFTGRQEGVSCYREGKVRRVEAWLRELDVEPAESWFYSDSINDLPLLNWVDHPVAVNPDPRLAEHARLQNWRILQRDELLREETWLNPEHTIS